MPVRISKGGAVFAPDNQIIQFIDVRDLAKWIVRMVEEDRNGVYNATVTPISFNHLLNECQSVVQSTEIENVAKDAGGLGKGLLVTKAHSQAGLILNNFRGYTSEAMCKSMRIYTFGTAKHLDTNHFESATNFVSLNDIVPKISDPLTYIKARFQPRSDIIFLNSKTLPFIDHPFDGVVYQEANKYVNTKINELLGRS